MHFILKLYSQKKYHSFLEARSHVSKTQAQKLKLIFQTLSSTQHYASLVDGKDLTYDQFAKRWPVTTYADYQNLIDRQRETEETIISSVPQRYQPTSGSTNQRKWIPYTKEFLRELDQASLVWLHDLYLEHPKIRRGTHYWSLSWLPSDLRHTTSNDDLDYLDAFTKNLLSQVMAVPQAVQNTASLESSLFATICYLVAREDLSFVFVWSPTFFLSLLQEISLKRDKIVKTLETGEWSEHALELASLSAPRSKAQAQCLKDLSFSAGWPQKLWRDLSLLSCWTSADSGQWIPKIKTLCPELEIQGKGLFATEGVVTIPVQGKLHLSFQSHFYEFLLQDGSIKLAHQLVPGEKARVLITSSHGLVRYDLGDELRVVEMVGECPVLEFLGRALTVDLVGEKISHSSLRLILQDFRSHFKVQALGFLAGLNPELNQAQYVIVIESPLEQRHSEWLETNLRQHHHYALARELGQLASARVIYTANGLGFFDELIKLYGWNKGDVKWETVLKVPTLTININE